MIKNDLKARLFLVNFLIFLSLSFLVTKIFWTFFGKTYVFSKDPVGGDYFNALTYIVHLSRSLPNPLSGWLSFWNEGSSVIGGYPFMPFYLVTYLAKYFAPSVAMNYFSFATLALFFIFSLLLFWQVSKNWILSIGLLLILATTHATFYQLTVGGFIASASAQMYLPLILFFIFRFGETNKEKSLILGSIVSGISLVHQAPSTILMAFLPSLLVLVFQRQKAIRAKLLNVAVFTLISLSIGSVGLYGAIIQTFLGSGTSLCTSPQCWGDYPTHLERWLSPISAILAAIFTLAAIILKLFEKKTKLLSTLPSLAALFYFVGFASLAYFKLIDGVANVIFPTRVFWAFNLFLLLVAASAFKLVQNYSVKIGYFVASVTTLVIITFILQQPFQVKTDRPNTVPVDAESYILNTPSEKPLEEVIPQWVQDFDNNWRVDTSNAPFNQWANIALELPAVRGYSNHPIGRHQDWQYLLTTSTRNVPKELDEELVKNRALFLVDAYGIGVVENSQRAYPESLTKNIEIIEKQESAREVNWLKLSPQITSPIVTATNAPPMLFVGSETGYNSFIRSLAMVNLNSKILVPVKGPQNIGNLTKEDLKIFKTLVLYHYEGDPSNLLSFVKGGGRLFIEQNLSPEEVTKLPEIFPVSSQELLNVKNLSPSFQKMDSELTKEIVLEKFSPLVFENGPWKLTSADAKDLRSWGKTVLLYEGKIILSEGRLSKGYVIYSGLNLPFHTVDNSNLDEAKLFRNIITSLVEKPKDEPKFQIKRPKPEEILLEAEGFKGVYFKENYHEGWQAKIGNSSLEAGKKLKVYKAGLDFMYIPNPGSAKNVSLNFKGSSVEWAIYLTSPLSLSLALLYLFSPNLFKKLLKLFTLRITRLFSQKIKWF